MTREPEFDTGASYCGNCGTPVQAGAIACSNCGRPIPGATTGTGPAQGPSGPVPADYIPYCRSCGVVVNWGDGHTCSRCGITPLCALHFRALERLCFDCADARAPSRSAMSPTGLRCGACGAAVAPYTEFCPNCGRAFSLARTGMEYVGFWSRAAAFIIDWIAAYLVAVLVAVAIGFSISSGEIDPEAGGDVSFSIQSINYGFLLLYWGISVAHTMLLTVWRGQTLGKMVMGIQVVDANGNLPPLQRIIARELVRAVILLALFPLGFMYLWVLIDDRRRGPQDFVGASFVVRKRRGSNPPSA